MILITIMMIMIMMMTISDSNENNYNDNDNCHCLGLNSEAMECIVCLTTFLRGTIYGAQSGFIFINDTCLSHRKSINDRFLVD